MNYTTWRPDTCDCTLHVNNDWLALNDQAQHSRCALHQNLTNQELFQQVYHKENKLRNETFNALKENHPDLFEHFVKLGSKEIIINDKSQPVLDALGLADSEFESRFKEGHSIDFDEDRKIVVTLGKDADKAAIAESISNEVKIQ